MMNKQIAFVLDMAAQAAWAIEPAVHKRMMEVLIRQLGAHSDAIAGHQLALPAYDMGAVDRDDLPERKTEMYLEGGGVAVIPVQGVIAQRGGAVGRWFSNVGTSVEHIRADLREAVESDEVRSIVLQVDSPGGSVSGIDELGDDIRAARKKKPIVAHTDSIMASAAYWLSAQSDQIVATKDAIVGSVGVIASFFDWHRMLADMGIDPVIVKSTVRKGGVQSNASVSDSDRAEVQGQVDHFHAMFVDAIASGRGIEREQADAMADGTVHVGDAAQARGFIDQVGGIERAVRMARTMARGTEAKADQPEDEGIGAVIRKSKESKMKNRRTANGDTSADEDKNTAPAPAPAPAASEPAPAAPQPVAPAAPSAGVGDPVAAERSRVSAIMASASDEQSALAQALVADGTPAIDAITAINADLRSRMAANQQRVEASGGPIPAADASLASGNADNSEPVSDDLAAANAMEEGFDKWAAIFAADPKVRRDHASAESYAAYEESMRGRCEPIAAGRSAEVRN